MKKFSNVSGSFVGEEKKPVVNNEQLELDNFKHSIMKLMDDFLSIRSYGVARPEIMIPTKIVGKELFVEALTDLLSKQGDKKTIKVLESLKNINTDWKSIDEKIEDIKGNRTDIKEEKKIKDILTKWGSDDDNLSFFLESYVQKTKIKEDAFYKHKIAENMFLKIGDKRLKLISEKFFKRYNDL